MKVLLSGGGTAGHINPAISIAQHIKQVERNAEILFIGSTKSMEAKLVNKAGFAFKAIDTRGFYRSFSPRAIVHNLGALRRIFTSSRAAKKIIKDFAPDVAIGTGGYVSGPVIRAAQKLNIPTFIHEQNAFPGITNKLLSKRALCVMLAVPGSEKYFPKAKRFEVTGNPVRQDVIFAKKEHSRKKLGLDERPVILAFGGSLGARPVNEAVTGLILQNIKKGKYQFIHGTGSAGYEAVISQFAQMGIDLKRYPEVRIMEYIDNMPDCLAAADLVICRAGALTISELEVQGKPSILIPSPYVAENHQFHNAKALADKGAAKMIEEKDLTPEILCNMVDSLFSNPKKLEQMGTIAQRHAIVDSCDRIYSIIKDFVK